MAEHSTVEDNPAKIEIAVQKYRREQDQQRQRRSRRRRILLIFSAMFLCPCCCYGIFFYAETNLPAEITTRLTKYPGAKGIEHVQYRAGSAPATFDYYVFWTDDSVSSVMNHYEKLFPQFEQDAEPEQWSKISEEDYPVVFSSYSDFLDMTILVLSADQGREWLSSVPFHDWVKIPDDAPRKGTLIVVAFYTSYLID